MLIESLVIISLNLMTRLTIHGRQVRVFLSFIHFPYDLSCRLQFSILESHMRNSKLTMPMIPNSLKGSNVQRLPFTSISTASMLAPSLLRLQPQLHRRHLLLICSLSFPEARILLSLTSRPVFGVYRVNIL